MESTVSIEQFQEELQTWKHELSSIKQEIRHFENQLVAMSAKNLPKHLLAHLEHFQNAFICQKEVIDKLRHDLPDSRHNVENIFKNQYSVNMEEEKREDALREKMDTFRRIYEDVRDEFRHFETEWM